jgi:exodeoxyribonuclease V alpha subunit
VPTVEGILERIVYHNEENAFSVVRVQVAGPPGAGAGPGGAAGARQITAVGNLVGLAPGESVRLEGRWVQDRTYGEQLRVERYTAIKPATVVGIERYLASGLVKGLGPALAARLVEHFGTGTLEVIEHQPGRLTEVAGIGPVRQQRLLSAWAEQREVRQVMVFLQSHEVSPAFAARVYKRYGAEAERVVTENPYRLAVEVHGIGFLTADRIAASLGICERSPRRAEAALLHVLGEAADEGHLYLPRSVAQERTTQLLERPRLAENGGPPETVEIVAPTPSPPVAELIAPALEELARTHLVVLDADGDPADPAVYLAALHTAEAGAAERLRSLLSVPVPPIAVDADRAIRWLEEQHHLTLGEEQREAIRAAPETKLLVITGGPGTGKTTLLKGILQILEKKGRRIVLCAPTGRAAKRMTEAVGMVEHQALTLHRLLEYSPRGQGFLRNSQNPLDADVCIVDEASMVDAVLFYHLLGALRPRCQLVLVGDIDQLPSVGPGAVLGEVIRSGVARVVRLAHIFRQAEQSLIVVNAHRINHGELPLAERRPDADCFVIERETPEQVTELLRELVLERIPRRFGFDPVDDLQVLTPMLRGSLGVAQLNAELQSWLNPHGESVVRGSKAFRVGDKVMQLRNNYDLDVYNGDVGRLVSADATAREVLVRFDERLVTYDLEDLDELGLSYACSIHKSQGSEYPCVIIPLHTQHYVMLQRNLLYTALTRGKRLVVLIGPRRALSLAVKNHRVQARYTRFAERLGPAGRPGSGALVE